MGYSNKPKWTPAGAFWAAVGLVDSFADVFKNEKDQGFVIVVKFFLYFSILPLLILIFVIISFLKHLYLRDGQ